jgi:ABC-2 type transport system ATP-binding protein
MRYLTELRERDGVTSLLTTHLMDEADRCTRVAVLDQGRLVALDTPSALKSAVGGDVVTITTADPSRLAMRITERFGAKAEVLENVIRMERDRGHEFVPLLVEAFPGEIDSVSVGKPTLEDVFVHLTGHSLEERSWAETFSLRKNRMSGSIRSWASSTT